MMIRRRFVNVVAENYKTGVYSLHRLDVSKHLFHESRADARVMPLLAEAQVGDEQPTLELLDLLQELPAPCVKIHPSRGDRIVNRLPFWELLSPRSSEDKSLCINWMGDTMLCDAGKQSVDPIPHLRDEVLGAPISFSVVRPADAQDQDQEEEEDLYVIHNVPQRGASANAISFRVLRKDAGADGRRWRWESLPPPPFVGGPRYDPPLYIDSYTVADGGRTICCTVVDGGRTICCARATPGTGTYCFDTVEREWRHAGDWVLPFLDRAEYVPDLSLWLGFSPCSPSYYLCGTTDLNAIAMATDHPPKLQYVWQDFLPLENWSAGRPQVVGLGSGRFCIAKAFVIENRSTGKCGCGCGMNEEWWKLEAEVLVLTGIEVGKSDDEQRLKVWKHKSILYGSMFSVKGVI